MFPLNKFTLNVFLPSVNAVLVRKFIDLGDVFQTREKQARTKSAELLKTELESEENLGCTEYLSKVRRFVCLIVSCVIACIAVCLYLLRI